MSMGARPLSPLTDASVRAALAMGLDAAPSPRAGRLADFLARAFGPSTVALVHYGSHAYQSDPTSESAHDFFAIVENYGDAYRSLAATVGTRYRPGTAAALNHVLPPNVIEVRDQSASPPLVAKVAVFSLGAFQSACSTGTVDHFVRGRLFQAVQLVWTRDPEWRRAVVSAVVEARAGSFEWGRMFLPRTFDADTYCSCLLAASFAAEIRPESRVRISSLLDAQRPIMVPMYAALLQSLARGAVLDQHGELYTNRHATQFWERLRWAVYFRRSKLRATLRWGKYVALYDDWLDYVVRKIARRSGVEIELSPRERRWPLIFLWPKAIRFLRSRPQRQE
jgi:hypothetical protein